MARQDILYSLLQACTVRLSSSSGIGSGFFVAPGGWILTCEHVVGQNDIVEVLWTSGKRPQSLTARVRLRLPIPIDIAILELEGKAPDHKCVYLDRSIPQIGDFLYTFGYPQGYGSENYVGDSATTNYEGASFQDDVLVLKLKKGQIQEGCSGSPLLNVRTGKVCGIVSVSRNTGSDLGGRATPIPLLFQPDEIAASEDDLQLIVSVLRENKQFHQKIDKKWHRTIYPPFWSRRSFMIPCLSIVSLLIISLSIWIITYPMPTGSYNIAITNLGKVNRNDKLEKSEYSETFKDVLKEILEDEKKNADNTVVEGLWNISRSNKYELVANCITELEKILETHSKRINADLLVYGLTKAKEDNNLLTLNFYVPPYSKFLYSGLIDTFPLKGMYSIGEYQPVDFKSTSDLEITLSSKVRPLFWLIAGLEYISTIDKDPKRSLKFFDHLEKILVDNEADWPGKEIFYFCMGQSAHIVADQNEKLSRKDRELYLQKAEHAFTQSKNINKKYIRPLIGLGSIHATRAEWAFADNQKNKGDTELNKAIAKYEEADKLLQQTDTKDTWSEYAAPLGLGLAWIHQGYTEIDNDRYTKAEEYQKKAVEKINKIIKYLKEAKEFRLLGQASFDLGEAYVLGEYIHWLKDHKFSLEMLREARKYYLLCKDQGKESPNDIYLNSMISEECGRQNKYLEDRFKQDSASFDWDKFIKMRNPVQ